MTDTRYCSECGQEIPDGFDQDLIDFIHSLRGVRRIVINVKHGGFGLSTQAIQDYLTRIGVTYELREREDRYSQSRHGSIVYVNDEPFNDYDIERDDPALVEVVKSLGEDANGAFAELKIVTIPADVEWEIAEYDGLEWVAEKHRRWR